MQRESNELPYADFLDENLNTKTFKGDLNNDIIYTPK